MARHETELRSLEVRNALLDAGIAAFLGGGFAAASVGDIVKRAGVPKGSFYYYFDSKDALACAAVGRYAEFDGDARARLLDAPGSPLARLRGYFADHAAAFRRSDFTGGCLLGILGLEMVAGGSPVAERVRGEIERWAVVLASVIEAARAVREIAAPQPSIVLARVLISAWEGALIRMRLERDARPLDEFQDIVLGRVLQTA